MRPLAAALSCLAPLCAQVPEAPWLGPELWANRLQDWFREGDEIVCRAPAMPWRTAHWLTRSLAPADGAVELRFRCRIEGTAADAAAPSVGFWVGAGSDDLDWRAAALVQAAPGPHGGFLLGVDGHGRAFVRDMRDADAREPLPPLPELLPRDRWAIVSADGHEADTPPEAVLDGDPDTIWHTPWREAKPGHPHEIVLDLGLARTIGGLFHLPRQDAAGPRVAQWALFASESLDEPWGEPVAEGAFPDSTSPNVLRFVPVTARYLRFVGRSAHGDRPVLAIAELAVLPPRAAAPEPPRSFVLTARITGADEDTCRVEVVASHPDDGRELSRAARDDVPREALRGSLAIACGGGDAGAVRFSAWTADGGGVKAHPARTFGPIAGVQYTVSRGVLKLTAQLLPIANADSDPRLEFREKDGWRAVATAPIVAPGFTATFRVEDHDAKVDRPYRVVCRLDEEDHTFEGTIRREPDDRRPLVLAAFTGNHNVRFGFGRPGFPWSREGLWFPHDDLVAHVRAIDPDLLFFSGDQVYEGASPTPADRRGDGIAELDYLYKWLLWVWAFRDVTRDRPTVTLPDDHDVYQGNLWGASGRAAKRDHDGGYVMPAEWVRMVERTQTSHLPDPVDPAPIEQGIGVHFGRLVWGGVDFAILEDRKFKSGPNGLVPPTASGRPDHVVDPEFDPRTADVDGAELLGERQLRFLEQWAADWSGGARMKATLSGTVFAGLATHHGPEQHFLVADYDSNGWPQSGRNAALRAIRKGFGFLIGGDQHLATLAHLGVEEWRDAGWSFAVPSIANFYPRAWRPATPGAGRAPGQPEWAGDHRDGFGNPVTVWAATNPESDTARGAATLASGMPGFGVVRFDTRDRTVRVECWPRSEEPAAEDAAQYPGWPQSVHQLDNYGRRPVAWLPELRVMGLDRLPVVELRTMDGDLVWSVRAQRSGIRPFAFAEGRYRVRIGDPDLEVWRELELDAVTDVGAEAPVDVAF